MKPVTPTSTAPSPAMPRLAPWLLLVLTLVWGTTWPVFSLALSEMSVWTFRAISLSSAGLTLLLLARHRGHPLGIPRQHWPLLAFTAWSFLSIWNVASTYATTLIPSGQAALLGFTMPLWAALFSRLLFGAHFGKRQMLALMLGAAAVVTLMIPSFAAYADAPLGMFYGLLSGAGWALGTVLLKYRPIPVPVMVLTGWQLLVSAVPVVIGALYYGDYRWFMPSAASIGSIVYITVFPMLLGNLLWFTLMQWLPAQILSLSPIMVPMVAMVSGAIALGEPLGPRQWLAMLLSASALALVLFRPGQNVRRTRAAGDGQKR